MKKITTLLLLSLSLASFGQRMKYKELFPTLSDMSTSEQLSALRDFVASELDHPNANFRLALLHEKSYKQADPLTQFESVMAHAQEASKRYIKAKQLVTEQQVRSDNEYYAPIFGQVDAKGKLYAPFPLVQTKIQNGFDSANLIQQKLPAIYQAFTKSVNQYDKAVKLFAAINTTYKSEEDILMFFTVDFDVQLSELILLYDSSQIYFEQYKSLLTAYPLKKYKQRAAIKEITTYRLDGLINRMTFLENTVVFWNYRKWAEGIRDMHKKDIQPMLERLSDNERKIDEVLAKAVGDASVKPAKIDKELIYNLNNYDKNSLALSLLRYKAFKQEWLLKTNAISTDTAFGVKLELFSTLIQQNRVADSLHQLVKQNVNEESILKHKKFLDNFYNGSKGLDRLMADERAAIDKSLTDYQQVLKTELLRSSVATENILGKFVKFGTSTVPLFTSDTIPSSLNNLTYVTTMRLVGADGGIYLTGVSKPDKKMNNLVPFVARVNPDGKPAWIQNITISIDSGVVDTNGSIKAAVLTQEGCAFVVSSTHLTRSDKVNTLVYITEKKEEKLRKRLKDAMLIRKLLYVEGSNTFVMVMKGDQEIQNFSDQENCAMVSINVLGDLVWRRDVTLAGTFLDFIQVRDGFVMAGNFTWIRNTAGKELRTRLASGQSNPYLLKISERGDIQKILPLTSDKSVYADRLVKVNDGSINLLAYELTFDEAKAKAVSDKPAKHVMVNYDLKVICSTL